MAIGEHRNTAATLSMWDDVDLVYAFTYYGFHAEVLKRRDDWLSKVNGRPSSVGGLVTTSRPHGRKAQSG